MFIHLNESKNTDNAHSMLWSFLSFLDFFMILILLQHINLPTITRTVIEQIKGSAHWSQRADVQYISQHHGNSLELMPFMFPSRSTLPWPGAKLKGMHACYQNRSFVLKSVFIWGIDLLWTIMPGGLWHEIGRNYKVVMALSWNGTEIKRVLEWVCSQISV